jgi:N-formylglutamate deformylase
MRHRHCEAVGRGNPHRLMAGLPRFARNDAKRGSNDMELFELRQGDSPLIISIPHAGTFVPDEIKARFTDEGKRLPDTDWHVPRLYEEFIAQHNVTCITANYSRYVIDLNRPPDNAPLYPGQKHVPLCAEQTFEGADIYRENHTPDDDEIATRLQNYWQPYHGEIEKQITRIKKLHGFALLYDAHSIRSVSPLLFEGQLPDLNLGTVNGASCAEKHSQAAYDIALNSGYSAVLNGRFIGGYITRHYGDPANHVHALQMELAEKNYMDEDSFAYDPDKAGNLIAILTQILSAYLHS